jgi:Predicted nucleic acid-binding protein, contains PIN domain
MRVVPFDTSLIIRGLDLFRGRPDKEWSLTDCISFVVMEENGLTDAVTTDRHFVQAGFNALMLGAE